MTKKIWKRLSQMTGFLGLVLTGILMVPVGMLILLISAVRALTDKLTVYLSKKGEG